MLLTAGIFGSAGENLAPWSFGWGALYALKGDGRRNSPRSANDGEGADLRGRAPRLGRSSWRGHCSWRRATFRSTGRCAEFRHRRSGAEVVCLARTDGSGGVRRVRFRTSDREQVCDELRADGQGGAPGCRRSGLLKRAEAVDEAEDARYGEDARRDELGGAHGENRLAEKQKPILTTRGAASRASRNPKGGKPYQAGPATGAGLEGRRATSRFPRARIMKTLEGFQATRRGRGQPGGGSSG